MEHTDTGRADPLIGRVLDGRYRVGSRVARGGMATVYEATDLRLDRSVAVKVMHNGLGDDEDFIGRFEREARSAARLAHHNAVAVFDTGEDQGTLFLVMEYVPGHTLRDLIRKDAPMAPAKALALLEPVLAALAAAHGAGMIHRDVKPENVLIAEDGRVKVADFGLARAVNAETQHTATGGVIIGTVSYLAPELVVDGKADTRSDVYSAGVLLYELLTGSKPHQAENPIQVAYKHVHEDIPAPSLVTPGIPPYVDALVARATAREQALRPADARVLLAQVRRVRVALDAGLDDDPELTADLAPRATSALVDTAEALDAVPEQTGEIGPRVEPRLAEAAMISPDELTARVAIDSHGDTDALALMTREPREQPVRLAPTPKHDKATTPPPERPVRATRPGKPRRSRRGPLMLVLLLLAALALGAGAYWFGIARYTNTPGVLGMPEAAAVEKIRGAGLDAEVVGSVFDESVPKGAVVSTDPGAGDRILKNGTIELTLSKGPERYNVPVTRGKTLDEAQDLINAAHLTFGNTEYRYHPTVPKDRVISMDPKAGTPVRRDTAINLVISRGPRPIGVPDFTGARADRAEQRLEELGFEVEVTEEFSTSVPDDIVISQAPDSGTLFKGDEVTLVVSKGPETVAVPQVVPQPLAQARKALEALGLTVKVVRSPLYVGAERVGGMQPSAGTQVRRGSTVTLWIV